MLGGSGCGGGVRNDDARKKSQAGRRSNGGEAMGLIACPDCTEQVSSVARACPRCGYPVGDIERTKRIKLVLLICLANFVVFGAFMTWRHLAS